MVNSWERKHTIGTSDYYWVDKIGRTMAIYIKEDVDKKQRSQIDMVYGGVTFYGDDADRFLRLGIDVD